MVAPIDWSRRYQLLLQELAELAQEWLAQPSCYAAVRIGRSPAQAQKAPSWLPGIRRQLIAPIAPLRSLLVTAGNSVVDGHG